MADDVVDPSPRPLPDVIAGRYRIVSRLGVGGMGIVYKAIDLQLNRAVAVKALEDRRLHLPGATTRLREEAMAAASLDHPYVCKVYEVVETSTDTYMVMEFVEGETLAALLKRGLPPLTQTLLVGREIAEGLAAAHARGLVHRDVKPANVMVMPNGHVKLLDFGVSGLDVSSPSGDTHTQVAQHTRNAGTPHYMAPEQAAGQAVTTRADLFSFGVLLYECLTGSLPFPGSTTFDYVRHVMQSAPRRLDRVAPHTPAALVDLVERCLEKTPALRPDSTDAVVRELQALALAMTSSGAAVRTAGEVRARRRWTVVAAIAASVVVVALIAGWLFLSPPVEPLRQSRPFITTPAVESHSRISPDAQWVSFIATAAGASRIMLQRIDGGESRPLTLGPGRPISQVWSPDGSQIAAALMIDGIPVLQIYPAFFGGAPAQSIPLGSVTDRISTIELSRWIGREVYLLADTTTSQGTSLRRVSLDSPAKITTFGEAWKLDGTLRSVDVRQDGRTAVIGVSKDGQEDLWTVNLDGSSLRRLTDDASFDRNPLWLGPEDRVVFQSNRGGQIDLWIIDVRTKALTPLTTNQAEEVAESTSLDGRTISFHELTKDANLWDFSGDSPQQLTQDSLSDYSPVLSGDGRVLVFQRSQPMPSSGYVILDAKVFVSSFDGQAIAEPRFIADGFAPNLSSDGHWLAYYTRRPGLQTRMALSVRDLRAGATFPVSRSAGLPSLALTPVEWGTRLTAWGRSGDDLYFVDVNEADTYVLRRYRAGQESPGPPLVTAPDTLARVMLRDLYVSPDNGRLAFLLGSRQQPTVHELDPHTDAVRNIVSFGKDEIARSVVGRGWLNERFVLIRAAAPHEDGTQDVEVLLTDNSGGVTSTGRVPGVYVATIRLHPSRRMLYMTRSEQGTSNIYAFSLDTAALTAVTKNRLPGITFSGFQPAGAMGVIGVREERRDDIWLIQHAATARTGNPAGR